MKDSLAPFLVGTVKDRLGLAAEGGFGTEAGSRYCDVTPTGLEPGGRFSVRFRVSRQSAEATFMPYTYAADLIAAMGGASPEGRLTYATLAGSLRDRKLKLSMSVNGASVDPVATATWPGQWKRLDLSLGRQMPVFADAGDEPQVEALAAELVVPILALVIALTGVEDASDADVPPDGRGLPEGRPFQTLVTRYERKGANREACIQSKGVWCHACGFDFERFYGMLGAGYIEVHHIVPVSRMGAGYMVNPGTDLVPLCANCHAMVHRHDPPMPVEKLARLLEEQRTMKPTNGNESRG